MREAWVSRHLKDGSQFSDSSHPVNLSTIAGIVAQIKWLAIGSIGEKKMKKVINEMKKKINASKKEERKKKQYWDQWVKNSQGKAEKDLLKRFKSYLTAAKNRYAKRIEDIDKEQKSLIVDRESFLAIQEERQELDRAVGDEWLRWWMLTGNQQLSDLYRRAGREKPLDLVFGNRDYARQLWNSSLEEITNSTGRAIMRTVERGLNQGLSTREIAASLEETSIFTLGRANTIARTESTRVVNEATTESYRQLAANGIQVKKQWLSSRDAKVRDSHVALDGQIVGANEEFQLPSQYGGYSASSPASFPVVGENVNCRCTIIPVLE